MYAHIRWGSSGRGCQIQDMLVFTCVQTASAVNRYYAWPCGCDQGQSVIDYPWVATCETVSHGQRWRSRSRDASILSVSSIISIIVAFTGRVPWFSAIAVILHRCRENERTLCNFSIWTCRAVMRCKLQSVGWGVSKIQVSWYVS